MNFDTLRPILSGLIGATVAAWLVTKWARWVPQKVGQKGREQLLNEHKTAIRLANVLGFSGMLLGLGCYLSGWLPDNDWRGAGLGVGLWSVLSVGSLAATSVARGSEAVKESLVAYAISQQTPAWVLFGLLGLFFIAGVMAAMSLLF